MKKYSENKAASIPGEAMPSAGVIKEKIETILNYDHFITQQITIDITGNKVTLKGTIDTLDKMSRLMYAIWETDGVDQVENRLNVLHNYAA